ncbi:cob(I)yrinic acid a,c-diamide adenosyltransferase [Acidimicrobiia bacterium EGI L10123]|uniref:cob(I)yrinic acid a,c-diamide adenosyltransferase n=1 Tax=Salinilacustrithrix flava TaxID=2957203 RepID=UPI003D7C23BB|nr:cob(I)yrinic acid a,c-diamide adenosyltransferase [Acidimicrobiia bacterium EGI L10123]
MSDTPTDAPPTEHQEPPELRRADSLVLVNTGNGKGKSTAAFGTMIRSVARGWPVAVVQFLKSGKWNTGEEKVARDLGVEWFAIGEGFTWDSEDLSRDEAVAREAWRQAASLLSSGTHRLVVLDEITYPMNWGWFDTDEVVAAIRDRSPKVNVICTGRDAPEPLLELADTATEMRVLKHAYQSGIRAMKGIDY